MFRNFSQSLRAGRIVSLVFATLLIAAVTAPLEASGVTNLSEESRLTAELQFSPDVAPASPPDETIRVHIWIPGFDDDEPVFICSPIPTPNPSVKKSSNHGRTGKLAGVDACNGMLRMLPWITPSAPLGRVEFLLPII